MNNEGLLAQIAQLRQQKDAGVPGAAQQLTRALDKLQKRLTKLIHEQPRTALDTLREHGS